MHKRGKAIAGSEQRFARHGAAPRVSIKARSGRKRIRVRRARRICQN